MPKSLDASTPLNMTGWLPFAISQALGRSLPTATASYLQEVKAKAVTGLTRQASALLLSGGFLQG